MFRLKADSTHKVMRHRIFCAIFVIACAIVITHSTTTTTTTTTATTSTTTSSLTTQQKEAPATPALTPDDIKIILDTHNGARQSENALEMPALKWNTDLADNAQQWTSGCDFAHQPHMRRKWGENIAAVSNTRPIHTQLTAMINEWTAEKKFNIGGTFEECCSFGKSHCCHYTQVIWSRTTDVGCGYTVCPSLNYAGQSLANIAYLACYYSPPGNRPKVYYDWRPYIPISDVTPVNDISMVSRNESTSDAQVAATP